MSADNSSKDQKCFLLGEGKKSKKRIGKGAQARRKDVRTERLNYISFAKVLEDDYHWVKSFSPIMADNYIGQMRSLNAEMRKKYGFEYNFGVIPCTKGFTLDLDNPTRDCEPSGEADNHDTSNMENLSTDEVETSETGSDELTVDESEVTEVESSSEVTDTVSLVPTTSKSDNVKVPLRKRTSSKATPLRPVWENGVYLQGGRVVINLNAFSTTKRKRTLCLDDPIPKDNIILYAGPGNGKTHLLTSLKKSYLQRIIDTDDWKWAWPKKALIVTNRHELIKSNPQCFSIAFVSSRPTWSVRCASKCSNFVDSWFPPEGALYASLRIKGEGYLSKYLSIYPVTQSTSPRTIGGECQT